MFRLDREFLKSVGLGRLPEDLEGDFLQYVYDRLELRVGQILSEGMSEQQLKEFEALIDGDDQDAPTRWLELHRPDYRQVTEQQMAKLRAEIESNADQILADSLRSQADEEPSRAR